MHAGLTGGTSIGSGVSGACEHHQHSDLHGDQSEAACGAEGSVTRKDVYRVVSITEGGRVFLGRRSNRWRVRATIACEI